MAQEHNPQPKAFFALEAIKNEGYPHSFISIPNGKMLCSANGDFYKVEGLQFIEVTIAPITVTILKVETKDGIKGTYLHFTE